MCFLAESFEGSFMVNVRYFFVNTSDLISDVSFRRITKECFSFFFSIFVFKVLLLTFFGIGFFS